MSDRSDKLAPLLADPTASALREAGCGVGCLLVGGAVRDFLLHGTVAADWDLIVPDAAPLAERVAAALGGSWIVLGGARYDLHRVSAPRARIDLQEALAPTLDGELARRDLTINSIAVDLTSGEVHDPSRGWRDLEARVLRAPSPTAFDEDPIRVLRLLRFGSRLSDFTIDAETVHWARQAAAGLRDAAPERVLEELRRVLSEPRPVGLGRLLTDLGVYPLLWLTDHESVSVDPLALSPPSLSQLGDLRRELRARGDDGPREADLETSHIEALRHAALLATLDHEVRTTGSALMRRGWVTRQVGRLIDALPGTAEPPRDELERRRWIHYFGRFWQEATALRAWLSSDDERQEWNQRFVALTATAQAHEAELIDPPRLINGHEIATEFAIPPGEEMGRLIAELRQAQIDGAVGTPAEARDWLRRNLDRRTGSRSVP